MDVHSSSVRSYNMSQIRNKNTKPELLLRRALWGHGIRYRLYAKGLPGKPDLVLRKYNAVIFVHGCFWHCHECNSFVWPKSRNSFWKEKLTANRKRDKTTKEKLIANGWRVAVVWECALKKIEIKEITKRIISWLHSGNLSSLELAYLPSAE